MLCTKLFKLLLMMKQQIQYNDGCIYQKGLHFVFGKVWFLTASQAFTDLTNCPKSCSCHLGFSSMGCNDESTWFFNGSFSIFRTLRHPYGQNSGGSRSLTSLQIMFNLWSPQTINLNHQKITYFRHYVPWTKIQDDMNKSFNQPLFLSKSKPLY